MQGEAPTAMTPHKCEDSPHPPTPVHMWERCCANRCAEAGPGSGLFGRNIVGGQLTACRLLSRQASGSPSSVHLALQLIGLKCTLERPRATCHVERLWMEGWAGSRAGHLHPGRAASEQVSAASGESDVPVSLPILCRMQCRLVRRAALDILHKAGSVAGLTLV